ncbi:MAG TPA: hypothetical protein VGC21_16630 [Telluria sp.]|jgi:hypothetical protein
MKPNRLPLTFSVDKDSPLDVLEAVLAIARRGKLQLAYLQVDRTEVAVELQAEDADLLNLFSARLQNVIGVHDISMSESLTSTAHQKLALC